MNRRNLLKLFVKLTACVLAAVIVVSILGELNKPVWISGNNPQTLQLRQFPEIEENSLDMLIVGSCQAYQGVNPVELWDEYGISSYVLASPDQQLYTAYYYLLNALKTQKPKVVFLEALFMIHDCSYHKGYDQKAIYSMPLSKEKIMLSDTSYCYGYEGEKNTVGYYVGRAVNALGTIFPIFNFHARNDYDSESVKYVSDRIFSPENTENLHIDNGGTYNGAVPLFYFRKLQKKYGGYMKDDHIEKTVNTISAEYVEKIKKLCDENGIELIMFKTVSPKYWGYRHYVAVNEFCREKGIEYIDFNHKYKSYGFDLSKHCSYPWKLNADGMKITSHYLGKIFCEKYAVSDKSLITTSHYNNMLSVYTDIYNNAEWESVTFNSSGN